MAFTPYVEFANFTCKFGSHLNLVDLAREVVLPALTDDTQIRVTKRANYFLEDTGISAFELNGEKRFCAYGRLVKDTRYDRTYVRRNGKTERDEDTMEVALVSMFLLLLDTHKMIYLHETRDAPGIKSFESSVEFFVKQKFDLFIKDLKASLAYTEGDAQAVLNDLRGRGLLPSENLDPQTDALPSASQAEAIAELADKSRTGRRTRADSLANLRRLIPRPDLTVVPLASETNLRNFLGTFSLLSEVRITLVSNNDEKHFNNFIQAFRENKNLVNAKRASIVYNNNEGLKKDDVIEQIMIGAEHGQAKTSVQGKDLKGHDKGGDETKFTVKRYVTELAPESEQKKRAQQLFDELLSAEEDGTLPQQNVPDGTKEKLAEIEAAEGAEGASGQDIAVAEGVLGVQNHDAATPAEEDGIVEEEGPEADAED